MNRTFWTVSYGFRPGRSAHDALEALWRQMMDIDGGWIIDLDIRKFFDTMDHSHLRDILKSRVCDGVLTRLIGKWLKAGVMKEGNISYPGRGTPQGGVISPLLSNIYLHEVLDKWFNNVVKPRLKGRAFLIRYADDEILGFSCKEDALRVIKVLPKRFSKYGLTIHPEKTRMIDFKRPLVKGSKKNHKDQRSFNFLGFTHFWSISKKGRWYIRRKTEKSRFSRALKNIAEWCKRNRHKPISEQHKTLSRKLMGHYAYYGITGNAIFLRYFCEQVRRTWRKWLNRRSNKRNLIWDKFTLILERYPLPSARVVLSVFYSETMT
jgi:RNA-directed DNA polymerase